VTKCFPDDGILEGIFAADSGQAKAGTSKPESFVVEVYCRHKSAQWQMKTGEIRRLTGHDQGKAAIFLPDQIFHWYLYIIKLDVGRS
jgi:hypothetical protein